MLKILGKIVKINGLCMVNESEIGRIRDLIKWYREENGTPLIDEDRRKRNKILYFLTETETVALLVIPFLKALGYDDKQIMLEFSLPRNGGRPDIILFKDKLRSNPVIIVEVKKLDDHTEDKLDKDFKNDVIRYWKSLAVYYDFDNEDLKKVVITDGDRYIIYGRENWQVLNRFKISESNDITRIIEAFNP